ncbi:hypothetical protein [Pseudanabaena sp. PCC 6802]|uniref:hypothetical protein n=1 Tax=Pseudanabaena sp. PCC 6802 TaxID=118173 RepID=UPI0003465531|nr:hypothetical protein [Pseudanabaena sp. PCC 6802]
MGKRQATDLEVQQSLQDYLYGWNVSIKVTRFGKELTVLISRTDEKTVEYPALLETVMPKLETFKLDAIEKVRILGRDSKKRVEWNSTKPLNLQKKISKRWWQICFGSLGLLTLIMILLRRGWKSYLFVGVGGLVGWLSVLGLVLTLVEFYAATQERDIVRAFWAYEGITGISLLGGGILTGLSLIVLGVSGIIDGMN